jgi:hypothetical protein
MVEERRKLFGEVSTKMRAFALACLAVVGGCIIDRDPVRVESFAAELPGPSPTLP